MAPLQIVFLPATEPGDDTYGTIPTQIAAFPAATIHAVRYPTMVWYNRAVRNVAIEQIRSFGMRPITLIGFSKSGLGAWNVARTIPEYVTRTIIFDAPMARRTVPPWGTDRFYDNDEAWCADLPLLTINQFQQALPTTHQLILISGECFQSEMATFSQALFDTGVKHVFMPRPHLQHHWHSGWIEEGLNAAI